MTLRSEKSETDIHWNERARVESDFRKVNIADLVQRQLENQFILKHLQSNERIVEVGCGNGFLTEELRQVAAHVDAFDFAENMVEAAKEKFGETNNRFFVDSVLVGERVETPYDVAVCVRVLINLSNVDEQKTAISNIAKWLKPGGKLILVEGYLDGFHELNRMRVACGLGEMKPAHINFYSSISELKPVLEEHFSIKDSWHSGMFDLLTRVLYPLLEGEDKATGPSDFHSKILPLAQAFNPDDLTSFGRLRGFLLEKH